MSKPDISELKRDDYNWTAEPVVGISLMIVGGVSDSFGNHINPEVYYEVGKHKETGKVAILPTERNMRHEFINERMKASGAFN